MIKTGAVAPLRPLSCRKNFCQKPANNNIEAVKTMAEPDPAFAGQKATLPDVLDVDVLSVIGVIDGHNGVAALLRSSRGQIARVTPGDAAFGVTVTAIGEGQILLTDRWGRSQSLQLPSG